MNKLMKLHKLLCEKIQEFPFHQINILPKYSLKHFQTHLNMLSKFG